MRISQRPESSAGTLSDVTLAWAYLIEFVGG